MIITDERDDDTQDDKALSDSDEEPFNLATPAEKYRWGLAKGRQFSRSNVIVNLSSSSQRGRSAFAAKRFSPGDFVCEYRGIVKEKRQSFLDESQYSEAGVGCYCLDVTFEGKQYTIDATFTINDPGRYINHASRNCNLILMRPVVTGMEDHRRLRIGFVAKNTIEKGDELFYDYGIRDKDLPWTVSDAKKMTSRGSYIAKYKIYYDWYNIS